STIGSARGDRQRIVCRSQLSRTFGDWRAIQVRTLGQQGLLVHDRGVVKEIRDRGVAEELQPTIYRVSRLSPWYRSFSWPWQPWRVLFPRVARRASIQRSPCSMSRNRQS